MTTRLVVSPPVDTAVGTPTSPCENRQRGTPMKPVLTWLMLVSMGTMGFGYPRSLGNPAIHTNIKYWCMIVGMSRTNIEINDQLARAAQKLTGLKTKRAIVERALELLVRTERRKGLLRYYGLDIWKGNLRAMRRNRV